MLIDISYFTAGPRQIQNCILGKGTTMEMSAIMQYISTYQEEFLISALGRQNAKRVQDYLEAHDNNPELESDIEIESVCDRLRRPFADYVFFCILRDSNDQATVTGTVRLKTSNEYVSPISRQVTTWNRMVNELTAFAEWAECPLAGVIIDNNLLTPINRFNL